MARQSERLEREAEEARAELAHSLAQLRERMTPGQIVDEMVEYVRDTQAGKVALNLVRDVRDYPLPLVVIFAGITWAVIASAIAQRNAARAAIAARTSPVEPLPAEKAPVVAGQEWEVAPLDEAVE